MGVYMNIATQKIRDKGYSLTEFCKLHRICLRTYRAYEKVTHVKYTALNKWIDELEDKS